MTARDSERTRKVRRSSERQELRSRPPVARRGITGRLEAVAPKAAPKPAAPVARKSGAVAPTAKPESKPAPSASSASAVLAPAVEPKPERRPERSLKMAVVGLSLLSMTLAGLLVGVIAVQGHVEVEAGAPAPENKPEPAQVAKGSAAPAASAPAAAKPATPRGDLFTAERGATASGCDRAEVLIDGEAENFDGGQGFCNFDVNTAKDGGAILVSLPKPETMNLVRFRLWDKDDRAYTYVAEVSPDGKAWKTLKDASNEQARSWQEIRFEAQPVQAVRIKGLSSTANNWLHVVEVEGYNAIPLREPESPAPAVEARLKPGLAAEYYDGLGAYPTVEDMPAVRTTVASLNFAPQTVNAEEGARADWPFARLSATFSGYLKVDEKKLITFFITSDDGARLYVNGKLLVKNDGKHGMEEAWEQLELEPGYHHVYISYFDAGGGRGLLWRWQPQNENKETVPAERLFHDASAERGELALSR
ncbi:MAG: PA14 domain-containing protein [Planctomycetota bacterium]|nr:PA14 domain-containing protein [Planctomycetota bacterium]